MHLVILHIEDNPSDAHLMRAHLEDAKLQDAVEICVEQVTCLADALETLKRQPFNVILLDLHLHDSSGMDTLKALVKAMPVVVKVPIVVLSGSINDLQDVEECLANGAADALDKNFITPHSLLRTLIKVRMRANQEETAEDEILADLQDAVAKIEAIRSRINATDPSPGPVLVTFLRPHSSIGSERWSTKPEVASSTLAGGTISRLTILPQPLFLANLQWPHGEIGYHNSLRNCFCRFKSYWGYHLLPRIDVVLRFFFGTFSDDGNWRPQLLLSKPINTPR